MKNKISSLVKSLVYVALSVFIIGLSSCSKDDPKKDDEIDVTAIDKSKVYLLDSYENKLRDSVWYYYKVLSLWQDVIPPTVARDLNKIDELGYIRSNYTQYFEKADDVLDFLMSLTKNKLPNRIPELNYDWYSFLDRGGSVSSGIQETLSSGLGLSVFYLQTESSGNNADLYIRYVEKSSAADEAGIQRADQIIAINDDTKLDYDFQKATNFSTLLNYLNASSIVVKVKKTSGEIVEKTLVYKSYNSSPILAEKVIESNGKKIGYLMFNSFASIKYNGAYTVFYSALERVFSKFEQEGVNDLVIDLRYNGGGDVETAAYIANRIAPASETGKVMYTYGVNQVVKDWGWLEEGEEFAPVKFSKRGNLNLNRVYFIGSPNTASASELLINSLKPVMSTYLVGTYSVNDKNVEVADKTYGKPVGFFGLPVVDDHVELYVTSFKMFNRNGEGDYFAGLTPNSNVWEFRSFRDFGDVQESMLDAVLNHIQNGSFTKNAALRSSTNTSLIRKISKEKSNSAMSLTKNNLGMYKFNKGNIKNN